MHSLIFLLSTWFTVFISSNPSTLSGNWTLLCFVDVKTKQKDYRPIDCPDNRMRFEFKDDGTHGSIYGLTTSNEVNGEYVVEHNTLSVTRFGGTKVAERNWGANDFWRAIRSSNSFEINEDTLRIYYADSTKLMIFISN